MKRTIALLVLWLLGWLGAPALPAQTGAAAQPAAAEQTQDPAAHAPVLRTLEMGNEEFFKRQYSHSVPYAKFGAGTPFAFYNVNLFQLISLGLLLVIFLPVLWSFSSGRPNRVTRIFRGWCLWIRDEMVYAVMGKEEGRKFAPYFIYLFFFVAAMNCIGLIPSYEGVWSTYTATGTPYVTGALALITLGTMLFFGMREHGVFGFVKNLLPHGLPPALIPLMLPIELIGLIVKPFALMIRLFANMLAGHLVIASLIGLIFLFAKMQGGGIGSYLTAVPAVGMTVFIYIIEAFVTLLQAYIFTYLSILFLHQAIHPEH